MTDDYLADPAFDHAPATDRVVDDIGIRSMVAAPLVTGDEVFGAIGAFSDRAGRLQRLERRPGPGAGRPRRRGHGERPAHRAARPFAGGAGRARRRRALAARDRRADQRGVRPAGRPPGRGRRGGPPARRGRRPDRPGRTRPRTSSRAPTSRARIGSGRRRGSRDPDDATRPGDRRAGGGPRPRGLDRRLPDRPLVPARRLGATRSCAVPAGARSWPRR